LGWAELLVLLGDQVVCGIDLGGTFGGAPWTCHNDSGIESVKVGRAARVAEVRDGELDSKNKGRGSDSRCGLSEGVDIDGEGGHAFGIEAEFGDTVGRNVLRE
jgi:hypothetical protein